MMEGKIPSGPGTVEKSKDWSKSPSDSWNSRKRLSMLRGDDKSNYSDNVKSSMANPSAYIAKQRRLIQYG